MKTIIFSAFVISSRYYYYKSDRRLTEVYTPNYNSTVFTQNVSDNAVHIENMPGCTFRALNRIFSKPDNAIHMENKPGRTFRGSIAFFLNMAAFFLTFRCKKVMALIIY